MSVHILVPCLIVELCLHMGEVAETRVMLQIGQGFHVCPLKVLFCLNYQLTVSNTVMCTYFMSEKSVSVLLVLKMKNLFFCVFFFFYICLHTSSPNVSSRDESNGYIDKEMPYEILVWGINGITAFLHVFLPVISFEN